MQIGILIGYGEGMKIMIAKLITSLISCPYQTFLLRKNYFFLKLERFDTKYLFFMQITTQQINPEHTHKNITDHILLYLYNYHINSYIVCLFY